jgi:hypothetical protein
MEKTGICQNEVKFKLRLRLRLFYVYVPKLCIMLVLSFAGMNIFVNVKIHYP